VDAVRCAVGIQDELKTRNAELPENRKMEFRIGVNLGDVVEDGEQILGDGVNIAARLESLSEAGGICISGTAFDHVRNKLDLGYEYLGEQTVKNIALPVRVYKVLMESEAAGKVIGEKRPRQLQRVALGLVVVVIVVVAAVVIWRLYLHPVPPPVEVASKEKMAFPLPDKPSIAVLPFVNMSEDPKQEYLADGLAEGIINGLSKCEHIFVIARNSTFTYKGKPVKVQKVAEEMGVRYVLQGSVQREGNRVRITAQLVDALTGHHLFSERYDRDLKGILTLQDEITMKVLTAVQVKLTKGEEARLYEKGTKNLEAYLKYLQAWTYRHKMNKEANASARQLMEEAIALDPHYPAAYAMLALISFEEVVIGASKSPRESLERAVALAKKAIALDDSNSMAHLALIFPYGFLREYDKAISEAERAVSLDPNNASDYFALGYALVISERFEEGIVACKKSLRLSPIPISGQLLIVMGAAYRMLGQYEEAVATTKKVFQFFGPDHLPAHVSLVLTYTEMGRAEEAHAEVAEVLRIDPNFSVERWPKPFKSQARRDQMAASLRKAGLK
jgi:adenylate cyclase